MIRLTNLTAKLTAKGNKNRRSLGFWADASELALRPIRTSLSAEAIEAAMTKGQAMSGTSSVNTLIITALE